MLWIQVKSVIWGESLGELPYFANNALYVIFVNDEY